MNDIGVTALGLILVAVVLFLNAVFVAAEFAYVTVRRTRVEQRVQEGSSAARRIQGALGNLDFYVAASQLGITMASIALGTLGEPVLASLIEPPVESAVGALAPGISHITAIAIAFLLINAMHIVFGEFVPKSIALQNPEGTAFSIAFPMAVFVSVFRPAIWILNASGNAVLRLVGMRVEPIEEETLGVDDLALTLESSAAAGIISRQEMYLARHVLQLSSVVAEDILIPRNEMIALSTDMSRRDVMAAFAQYRHTRFPVHGDSVDDVAGILDMKDILFAAEDTEEWQQFIRPPLFLPTSVSLERLLDEAYAADTAMVVLLDEYGGVAGVATIFDAIQFLAGHFPDEFDPAEGPVAEHQAGVLTIDGMVRLTDLYEDFAIEFTESSARTIGGLVMERLGRIPQPGDQVELDDYQAEVIEMDEQRVARIRLHTGAPSPATHRGRSD